jgi:hypothetical protein
MPLINSAERIVALEQHMPIGAMQGTNRISYIVNWSSALYVWYNNTTAPSAVVVIQYGTGCHKIITCHTLCGAAWYNAVSYKQLQVKPLV